MNAEWIVLIHVVGAIVAGFYLVLPFLIRDDKGVLATVFQLNRIGQFSLIAQFLTGGYLLSAQEGVHYSFEWMGLVGVVFLAIGALTGIMAGPLRRGEAGKAKTLATINAILYLAIIFLMFVIELYPNFSHR